MTINCCNYNKGTNILNSKSNSGSIKPQSNNISNIFHGTVNVAKQNPNNPNLDFNVVRDIATRAPPTLATPQNSRKQVDESNYCNAMQAPVQSNYSNTVSGNASYLLQPPVKRKNNRMGKHNLLIVGDSHIKLVHFFSARIS